MALGGLPPRVVIGHIIDGKHRRADLAVIGATPTCSPSEGYCLRIFPRCTSQLCRFYSFWHRAFRHAGGHICLLHIPRTCTARVPTPRAGGAPLSYVVLEFIITIRSPPLRITSSMTEWTGFFCLVPACGCWYSQA